MKSRAWSVTFAAVLAGIAIAVIQNKVVPCITVIQDSFQISAETAGWLSSIFCVMGIVMAFPGALIVKKIGLKRTGILSLLCALVGTLLGLLSRSVFLLMLSRVIEGIGAGLITIVIPSLISMWFAPEKRGLPMSLWSTWQIVAQALCFFFGMSITNAFGWQGIWVAGGIAIAVAILVFALLAQLPQAEEGYHASDDEEIQVPLTGGLNNKNVWLICIGMFFFTFANFGFVTWVASAWSQLFDLELVTANRYISLMFIWALPISIALGFVLNHVNHKRFCVLTFFLYAFAAAAAFLLPGKNWIVPYVIAYPFLESAVCASMWTLAPEAVKDDRHVAVAMALFGLLQNTGMLIGPPVAGNILDHFGPAAVALPVLIPCLLGVFTVSLAKLNTTEHISK